MRDATVLEQTNDRGHGDAQGLGVHGGPLLLFGAGDSLEHQHQGTARAAYVDGLVARIEDQHRRLQGWLAEDAGAQFQFGDCRCARSLEMAGVPAA